MSRSLLEIFDDHFSHVVFNQRLADKLYHFQVAFVNKNDEHMAFFGGKLLGVNVVRMTDADLKVLFDDILDVDRLAIKATMDRSNTYIDKKWKVAGDPIGLTCMYLIHRFLKTPLMSEEKRKRACMDCGLIFHYRWISAILRDYFKFPADPKLAQAAYANLSNRFLIKQLESWQKVFVYRTEEILNGLHKDTLAKFEPDPAIVYLVNDSQGRIRDMVKNIYGVMIKAQNDGDRIHTTSGTEIDTDGVEVIRDKAHGLESYTNYLLSVIPDRNSFVRQELVRVIVNLMHTMQERGFVRVLDWMSEEINHNQEVENLVRKTLLHSFNYLLENGGVLSNTKDLPRFLGALKGIYVSSRTSDPDLLSMRELGTKLIGESIGKTNEQTVAAIRTGLFLYICLRTYTRHYYSG